ncbi:hypothetical protein ElyMa_002096400 [Elysia marginata]|uniref:Uncharacterized protein n=1 Tax=Elysia marginata TaxID=1093978 RepID=A0AAV4FFR8_9GAST|nr:hypothetical protein ElyMa_002096400 [Elysia marginata]
MKTLGWWQVISDTASLLEGRCEIRFFGHQTVSNFAVNEEEDILPTKETVTVKADDFGEKSLDIPTRLEYTVVEEKDFLVSNYLSELVLKRWRNEAQRCPSEEHSLAARWCLSGSKSSEHYETCFSWRKRPANVEKRCDECLISSYKSSASSPFGVYGRSWYGFSRPIYALYIVALLIKIRHTFV